MGWEEKRYKLAPQMRDYDRVGDLWLPFIMQFHKPNVSLSSVTTDEHGFRTTISNGKKLRLSDFLEPTGKSGAVVGSSACFGVGASSDKFTLPSLLNQDSDTSWFNLGGRTFNSTQEWLLFLLYLPKKVDNVIIFSGVNNLVLSYATRRSSPVYNPIYCQSQFEHAGRYRGMGNIADVGVIRAMKQIARDVKFILLPKKRHRTDAQPTGRKYADIIDCFRRDMAVWDRLRHSFGFKLHFVLQPLASWIEKELTAEEKRIFEILDNAQRRAWAVLHKYLLKEKEAYLRDTRTVCDEFGVPFLDINSRESFRGNEWLFVDRVHMTDKGYEVVRKELRKEFNL